MFTIYVMNSPTNATDCLCFIFRKLSMAEANTGAVKTLLCQTAQSALDPTFCADPLKPKGKEDVKFPHAQSALTLSHHQRPSSASISPAHTPSNTTPPPIQKFLTLHKCSSLEIIEYSSGDDSPVVIKKVSANKANISGLYQHQHLHQVGYYGSQENFLKFSMLPKTSVRSFKCLYFNCFNSLFDNSLTGNAT